MFKNLLFLSIIMTIAAVFLVNTHQTEAQDLDPIPGAGWHYPWKDKYAEWKEPKEGIDERQFDQEVEESYGYDAKNVDGIKEFLPKPLYIIMKNDDVWGNRRINITPVLENNSDLFKKYKEETQKNKGKAKIDENGWLQNYVAGVPFPNPQNGDELFWNFKHRFSEDDRILSVANWVVNRRGQTKYQTSDGNLMFFQGRLTCDPKPDYEPNPDNLYRIDVYANMQPYELRGTLSVIKQFQSPDKSDELYMYLPSLRRVRHLSTAQRTDRLPGGQDLMWDNFDSFNGSPADWNCEMKGKKKMLVGHNCKPESAWVDGEHLSGVDQYYQYRDCYVNELTPVDPNYPYQRVIQYVDAETYVPYYSVWYDQEGKLALFSFFMYYMTSEGPYVAQVMNHVDMQRIHSTGYAATGPSYNNCLKPDYFSMRNLQNEYPAR